MSARAVQQQRAIHLYRHALKNIVSWAVRRELFWEEVTLALRSTTQSLLQVVRSYYKNGV